MNDLANIRSELSALIARNGLLRANVPALLPAAPYFDLAGEEFGRRLLLTSGADGAEYCLRPDFTLPIVRAYLQSAAAGTPAAYSYLGPVFRQRAEGPAEFEQAGVELLAQPDADKALIEVLTFVADAIGPGLTGKTILKMGGVGLFETLLAGLDLPDVWRPRIRHRFGHPEALDALLSRMAAPSLNGDDLPADPDALEAAIADRMLATGLSVNAGRGPAEIAARYTEKRALAAATAEPEALNWLKTYLSITGPLETAIEKIAGLADEAGVDLAMRLDRLRRIAQQAGALGFAAPRFDAGFAPRLDYYTGLVFELAAPDGDILASGGEYGRLLSRLGAKRDIAAVGCAVWVDRLARARGGVK